MTEIKKNWQVCENLPRHPENKVKWQENHSALNRARLRQVIKRTPPVTIMVGFPGAFSPPLFEPSSP